MRVERLGASLLSGSGITFLPAWPADGSCVPLSHAALVAMDEIASDVSGQLDDMGLVHETVFIYNGESKDGRPLVACQISTETLEVCLVEDLRGQGWIFTGHPGSERQLVRPVVDGDAVLEVANLCVRSFVAGTSMFVESDLGMIAQA